MAQNDSHHNPEWHVLHGPSRCHAAAGPPQSSRTLPSKLTARWAEQRAQETGVRRNFDDLPPAAQRALKEAEERRKAQDGGATPAKEVGGRGGKDPVRYGDWEIDGRAVDF